MRTGHTRGLATVAFVAVALAGCSGPTRAQSRDSIQPTTVRLGVSTYPGWTILGDVQVNEGGVVAAWADRVPPAGGPVVVISGSKVVPVTPLSMIPSAFGWMPGGKQLLVAWSQDVAGAAQLMVYGMDGRKIRSITLSTPLNVDHGLSVSRDGKTAVVAGSPPGLGNESSTDLYQVDLASGATEQLTRTPSVVETSPHYLPDQSVAYIANDGSVTGSSDPTAGAWVAVLDSGTGKSRAITNREVIGVTDAAPTPDGRFVVFTASPSVHNVPTDGLYAVPVAGGPATMLFADPGGQSPSVGPDEAGVWTEAGSNGAGGSFAGGELPAGGLLYRPLHLNS
jgi:Tol biopolymer transport system component